MMNFGCEAKDLLIQRQGEKMAISHSPWKTMMFDKNLQFSDVVNHNKPQIRNVDGKYCVGQSRQWVNTVATAHSDKCVCVVCESFSCSKMEN